MLDDGQSTNTEFSFLVVGDSGSGRHHGHNPQRRVAELMLQHHQECRFLLHTKEIGDINQGRPLVDLVLSTLFRISANLRHRTHRIQIHPRLSAFICVQ